jgi:hypothetical protein
LEKCKPNPLGWLAPKTKTENNKCGQRMKKLEVLHLLMGMQDGTAIMKMAREFLKSQKNRIIIRSSNPTSGNTSRRTESRISRKYLHTHVHSSTVHNNQKMLTTQIFIGG